MTRFSLAVATALTALVAAAPAGAAVAPRQDRPLRNVDVREADGGPLPAAQRRGRASLERALGDEGVVSTDRISGGARLVARTDGYLTGARPGSPAAIAIDYVRAHPDVFGLDATDLDGLRLDSRYRTADGVTHIAYTQTYEGIGAYDNVLLANVDDGGRLLSVGGAAISGLRVASIAPGLDAPAALAAAKREVGGSLVAPRARQGRGPERPTRFSNGDRARLTLFADGRATRLAWRLQVTGAGDVVYELVLDATSARVLKRRSLTEFADAGVYRDYPGALNVGGVPTLVDLTANPTWLNQSAGNSRLSGNNVHAYVDADIIDGLTGPDVEIAASPGPDWVFPQATFGTTPPCPLAGCTWDGAAPLTRTTNRSQATTQLFYLVNTFHDHLAAAPFNFTPAAGNFEATGGDAVLAETDNYDNPHGNPPVLTRNVNNASMTTLPDGTPPRLQMFLFDPTAGDSTIRASLNPADTADVVYHEYTHGLTNRSVGSGVGLDAGQSRAMGEGWSDWYALDFLATQGLRPDNPATPGEMTMGAYLIPGGLRTQGADCPVGDAACPGTGPANRGGYTLGDMGHVSTGGFEVHADGEIWLETLWDLRARLGAAEAERLITSGLRLSVNNPSFLEARDAILLADRSTGATHYQALWDVFSHRGMGYSARTTSSAAQTATEAFDLPPRLVHESTTVSDPAPGGNGNDVAEPGETVSVTETLRNPFAPNVAGISGVMSSSTPHVGVPQPNATWPDIAAGATQGNAAPLRVAIPTTAACDTSVQLNLAMTTNQGSFSLPVTVPVGSKPSADVPKTIPSAGTSSTLTFNAPGAVQGLRVRIDKLTHTFVGDLRMTLRSPSGTTITLMNRPGTSPTALEGAGGDDFVNLILDDGAPTAIANLPPTAPPGGYSGRFRPDQPLAAFNGQNRQGVWTLSVFDMFGTLDSGTLVAWGLRPSTAGCANSAPLAVDDTYAAAAGRTLNATSVLANDSDADANALTAVKDSDPAHGTLALAADGTFAYTPDAGYRGTDSFSYRASDGSAQSPDPAVVSISVGNDPPVAADDAYTTSAQTPLDGSTVLANDSDPNGDSLTVTLASRPAHGGVALHADGTFTYTPAAGFSGRDTFTYTAADAAASSPSATVAITVTAAPQAPPPPAPAKLQVLRAGVSAGKLDVLASITAKATGKVRVSYRSGGVTTRFDASITRGRIGFRRALPRSQRSGSTGIVTLTYAGSALVAPDSVTLRAARGKARLVRSTSRIDSKGRLRVAGTITPRARGVVRVRLTYVPAGGASTSVDYRAKIVRGRWTLNQQLPAAAAAAGGQLSIQFTGYEPLSIRGEQIAKEVKPGG
jgi:VCBS repeat-containing protein